MCNAADVILGIPGVSTVGKVLGIGKQPNVAPGIDPTAERIKAEQEATTRANATIVADQRRRRAARGLLSLGVDDQSSLGTSGKPAAGSVRTGLLSLGTAGYAGAQAGAGYAPSAAGTNVPGGYYQPPRNGRNVAT
jgi:hypothetical protein